MPDIATAPTATNAQTRAAGTKLLGFYLGAGNVKVDVLIDMANIAALDASGHLLPTVTLTKTLGSAAFRWGSIFGTQLEIQNSAAPFLIGRDGGTQTNWSQSGGVLYMDLAAANASHGAWQIRSSNAFTTRLVLNSSGNLRPGGDNSQSLGEASFRWSVVYAGTGTINTSDQRAKREIGAIPDEWLDAWGDVEWRRYKFIDGQRWHLGLVAQQVHAAFDAYGIDAFEIGLCCFDAWDEQREPVTELIEIVAEDGSTTTERRETGETRVVLEAGDRWGLRYEECQAIEAAWQRRELMRLRAALEALGGAL